MLGPRGKLLNHLERELPEGLLVDTAWLKRQGYSRQLLSHYVRAGWLEKPERGVYRRRRGIPSWQQAVISLQVLLLDSPLTVGGRTALELQGYTHYLQQLAKEIHLYGPKPPPRWLYRLPVDVTFVYHSDRRLFPDSSSWRDAGSLKRDLARGYAPKNAVVRSGFVELPWGQWDWPMTMSSPERAVFELVDELPSRESFHQVDKLFEGLTGLSPTRLQALLAECKSVKVKRLFFFFANRHQHAWLKRLDLKSVDIGTGKRSLVRGGKLDPATQITVPEDLDAVR